VDPNYEFAVTIITTVRQVSKDVLMHR